VRPPQEIIGAEAFDRCLKLVAVFLPVLALAVIVVGAAAKRRVAAYGMKVGLAGAAGPVVFGMWRFYSYLVRYDPRSGYFGLQSVKVLALCLLLFVVVGAALGTIVAYLTLRSRHRKE
jgi:tetrahydromethanopterin S-methyltransferase subunit C